MRSTLRQNERQSVLILGTAVVLCCGRATLTASEIELTLQTREPNSSEIRLTSEKVDPTHVGVIAVDVWNYHWCKTATMRVEAIVPRMNKALDIARSLGMTSATARTWPNTQAWSSPYSLTARKRPEAP
jgi:hypothetical protein